MGKDSIKDVEERLSGQINDLEVYLEKIFNKAGYTAVRCVPRRDWHICTRTIPPPLITPCPAPHPSFLPLPPLDIPSSSEVEFTHFCVYKTNALLTDQQTDPLIEMRGRI